MPRTITHNEMDRRGIVAWATGQITDAMEAVTWTFGELSVLEWMEVLVAAQTRVIKIGLADEWRNYK